MTTSDSILYIHTSDDGYGSSSEEQIHAARQRMSPTVSEILQLKQTIASLSAGQPVPRSGLDHLFHGRARGYIDAMQQLGQLQIDASRMILP